MFCEKASPLRPHRHRHHGRLACTRLGQCASPNSTCCMQGCGVVICSRLVVRKMRPRARGPEAQGRRRGCTACTVSEGDANYLLFEVQ